jgi:hypothetical protein
LLYKKYHIFCFIFCFLCGCDSGIDTLNSLFKMTEEKASYAMDASDFYQAFEHDSSAAAHKYMHKYIILAGRIGDIEDLFGVTRIKLSNTNNADYHFPLVKCVFFKSNKELRLSIGDIVAVKGIARDDLTLTACRIFNTNIQCDANNRVISEDYSPEHK